LSQGELYGSWVLAARTATDANPVVSDLRRLVNAIDPNAMIREATTVDAAYGTMLTVPRLSLQLMALFGAGSLLLALIGIYGIVSSAVAERTKEIGIRMALGADASQLRQLVVRDALHPALIGLALGAGCGVAANTLLRGLLYGVSPHDPATLVLVSAFLGCMVVVVAWLPARRATRLDPVRVLRAE
jgi:ABC-type antimicrobial peptide transport system permease subunit